MIRCALAIIGLAVAYALIRYDQEQGQARWHDPAGFSPRGPVSLREAFGFKPKTKSMSLDQFLASLEKERT